MSPGKLKLEKFISLVRQVCFLLEKRCRGYPGARQSAGGSSISTLQGAPARPSLFLWAAEGYLLGGCQCVGGVRGGGRDRVEDWF